MAKIFISYSSRDAEIADQVYHALRVAGHQVWMDREELKGGQDWLQAIQDNLLWADTLIVLWSANALDSEWVQDEIALARSKRKLIIPLRIDNTDPSNHIIINTRQLVDLRDGDVERAIARVNAAIEAPTRPGMMSADNSSSYSRWPLSVRRFGWFVAVLAVVLLLLIIVPNLTQQPLDEPLASPTAPAAITPSAPPDQTQPAAELVTLTTLNAWRQSNGYTPLVENALLQEAAGLHLGYLRSLSLSELDQTNQYRDADGHDAQWMAESVGYTGDVQMFVEINEGDSVLLDDLLFAFDTQFNRPQSDFREVGLVAEQALNTGRYYFVLILGT